MTTGSSSATSQGAPQPRRNRPLQVTLLIVGLLVAGFVFASQVYTDVLWYDQLGYLGVFITQNLTQIGLFLVTALAAGAAVWASLFYAVKHGQAPSPQAASYRPRPSQGPDGSPIPDPYAEMQELFNRNMARYQKGIESTRRALLFVVPLLLGSFIASGVASQWETVLLFLNRESFGQTDPEFGLDLGFFIFTLPFLNLLTGLLSTIIIFSALAGLVMHYFYGGLVVTDSGLRTSVHFRRHLALLAFLFLLVRAAVLWLARYNATVQESGSGNWAGAMYSDVNAIIPVKAILAAASLLVAALFIVALVRGNWRLPQIGVALLVITALVAGSLYPWIVQRFQVVPNEQATEAPYIQRNIDATRAAYGLDRVEVQTYDATTSTQAGALRGESETISNIRLLDPNVVSSAFGQLQQFRPYYQFDQNLSVDRYTINGKETDTVIAARELNPAQNANSSWVNQHVVYTHGYGVIAAYGNQVEADGKPKFIQSGIQATGAISQDYEPRIYFGRTSPDYSIVGGSAEDEALELDRPQGSDDQGGSDAKYTFSGNGGPNIGAPFNRLAYAIKFQSSDILLSDAVRPESQVLYDRNPVERVKKVAPYLTVDGNPYPAIVDGQVLWIVDAYTTASTYPYAQSSQLQAATSDSETASGDAAALPAERVNYIRNSVKATVNAYDGSVKLYAWDEQDPVLKSWQKVYPQTVESYSQMSARLMEHVRYPQDLFKVQREMLNSYHVTEAGSFYAGDDRWSTPNDPTNDSGQALPPYYLSLQMPGESEAKFSLTTSFIPQQSDSNTRNVMYGFLAANGDAGTGQDGQRHEDYGKLTLLELPRSSVVPGPGQAQNVFNSDTAVSTELNLLRQGASDVINGNLLTLPVGGGILYVQPVYVQSSGDAAYPSLRRVLVGFGEKVGFAPTLEEALDELFSGSSGAQTAADAGVSEEGSAASSETQQSDSPSLTQALQEAKSAMEEADRAMKAGDWAAYGQAQAKLNQALTKALEAEGQEGASASASASPSASPSPSASR